MWQVEETGGKLTKQVVSGGKGFVRRGKGFVRGGKMWQEEKQVVS